MPRKKALTLFTAAALAALLFTALCPRSLETILFKRGGMDRIAACRAAASIFLEDGDTSVLVTAPVALKEMKDFLHTYRCHRIPRADSGNIRERSWDLYFLDDQNNVLAHLDLTDMGQVHTVSGGNYFPSGVDETALVLFMEDFLAAGSPSE